MPDRTPLTPSRRSLVMGAAAAAPLLALGATSASALGGFRDAAGLTMIHGSPWVHPDIRSVDFRFETHGLVKTFPPSVRVTVPPGYDENPDRRYPVLLLLHGRGGTFLQWSQEGNAIEESARHDVIIVMPDGGAGSFYSNANFPLPGREAAWETFIMMHVLPFVDQNFRTIPERKAIAGLSMGGFGALALGQKYDHHNFRSISSYSGPGDCSDRHPDSLMVGGAIWVCPAFDAERYFGTANPPGATWGHHWYPQLARGYNPSDNIERYRGKRIFLRSGDGPWDFFDGLAGNPDLLGEFERKLSGLGGEVIEAVVHPNLERFSGALTAAGIENDYRLHPGATHDWALWKENLTEDLPGIVAALNA